ncbi:MAG: hypothetical protein V4520_00210 [Bacteroidota bacterium]
MNANIALGIATIYVAAFTIAIAAGAPAAIQAGLFIAAPFVLIWSVFTVLKDRSFNYPQLPADSEFGYLDEMR